MPTIRLAKHLTNQFDAASELTVQGNTIAAVIADLDRQHPGVAGYILDDQGRLRKHVNLFIGERFIRDRDKLTDAVSESDQVFVMQALSGG